MRSSVYHRISQRNNTGTSTPNSSITYSCNNMGTSIPNSSITYSCNTMGTSTPNSSITYSCNTMGTSTPIHSRITYFCINNGTSSPIHSRITYFCDNIFNIVKITWIPLRSYLTYLTIPDYTRKHRELCDTETL